ncbi:MAG: helix-turn-helix domain-containing protein [Spirulinaceae cyanobacterium]
MVAFSQNYRPIQPALATQRKLTPFLTYSEFPVAPELAGYIYCYWTIEGQVPPGSDYWYTIVPDGCIDILINCLRFEGAIAAGTNVAVDRTPFHSDVHYFGLRFLPGAIHNFIDFPAADAVSRMALIQTMAPQWKVELSEQLFEQPSTSERISVANRLMVQLLRRRNFTFDPRLAGAIHQMVVHRGQVNLEGNRDLGVSPRHLRRLFHDYLGIRPKQLARIIRFQYAMQLLQQDAGLDELLALGFYDQAHFIREFKAMTGASPTHFFTAL